MPKRDLLYNALAIVVCALAFILYAKLSYDHVTWRSRPYPIELPAPTLAPTRIYTLNIPIFIRPAGLFGKGIASTSNGAFNKELGASWWYRWSWCDEPGCVPMIRNWDYMPPTCPPVMMLGNEPNSIPPYGHSEPPEEASEFSKQVRSQCPNSWLVVGNVALPSFLGMSGYEWLQRYIDFGGQYDQLGAHCYASPNGNAGQCVKALGDLELYFPGVQKCVTEYGSYNPKPEVFAQLTDYVFSHYDCVAVFTDHDDQWKDVYGYELNLIDDEGNSNERGEIYRSAQRWR